MNAGYFLREAMRQAWRQRLMGLVAVVSLALAALCGGAWALLLRNAPQWNRTLGGAERLAVFLKPGLSPRDQALALAGAQAVPGVAAADLVTPEQAAASLSRDADLKAALDLLGENPLPASLDVRLSAATPGEVSRTVQSLGGIAGVDGVDRDAGAVENLLKAGGLAREALVGLMALFSGTALLMVAAALRLSAWSRREELGIMRLVGAGRAFMSVPFLLEGLAQGLAGGALAAAALGVLQAWMTQALRAGLGFELSTVLPMGVDPGFVCGLIASTGALGALGAALGLAFVRPAYEREEAW